MALDAIGAGLRAICLALPEASEELMRRGPSYRVADKIFALERPRNDRTRALVQGPGGLARDPPPSRAGAIFHSSLFWRQGLDRRRIGREGRLSRDRGLRPPQLSAGRAQAARQAGGVRRAFAGQIARAPRSVIALRKQTRRGNAMPQAALVRRPPVGVPHSSLDPFSLDFLRDPHPAHETLREAGRIVWLEKYGAYAAARHAEVRQILGDPVTFCSKSWRGLKRFSAREAVAAAKRCAGTRPART